MTSLLCSDLPDWLIRKVLLGTKLYISNKKYLLVHLQFFPTYCRLVTSVEHEDKLWNNFCKLISSLLFRTQNYTEYFILNSVEILFSLIKKVLQIPQVQYTAKISVADDAMQNYSKQNISLCFIMRAGNCNAQAEQSYKQRLNIAKVFRIKLYLYNPYPGVSLTQPLNKYPNKIWFCFPCFFFINRGRNNRNEIKYMYTHFFPFNIPQVVWITCPCHFIVQQIQTKPQAAVIGI